MGLTLPRRVDGTQSLHGAGVPSDSLGMDGDTYFREQASGITFYAKAAGTWSALGVLPSVDAAVTKDEGGARVSILESRFNLPAEGAGSCKAEIEAASLIAATEGKVLKFPGGRTYDVGAGLDIAHSDAVWEMDPGARFDGSGVANDQVIVNVEGSNDGLGGKTLTGPVDPIPEDSYTLQMSSAYAGLEAGDILEITSTEPWSTYQEACYKGELVEVASVSTTTVTLKGSLRTSYALSGYSVTVQKIFPVRNFEITGGGITGAGGSTTQFGLQIRRAIAARVRGFTVEDARCQGFRVANSRDVVHELCVARRCNQDGVGYGFTCVGAHDCKWIGNTAEYCRHGYDISGGAGFAVSWNSIVTGNHAKWCSSAGFSTHGGACQTTFSLNHAENCGGGFINRSPYTTISTNVIRGTRSVADSGGQTYYFGIFCQRERGGEYVTIDGNVIEFGNGYVTLNADAIMFSQLEGNIVKARVTNNLLSGFGRYGLCVSFSQNIYGLLVAGNIIDCRKQTGTWQGIYIQANTAGKVKRDVHVNYNEIDSPTSDAIRIYGGDTAPYEATGIHAIGNVGRNVPSAYRVVNVSPGYFGKDVKILNNSAIDHASASKTIDHPSNIVYGLTEANHSVSPLVYGNVADSRRASLVVASDLEIMRVGSGINLREGTNGRAGQTQLVAGTKTVATTAVTANSRILLSIQGLGTVTAPKAIAVTSRVAGTSFTITSADATDTSYVYWQIIEPASGT